MGQTMGNTLVATARVTTIATAAAASTDITTSTTSTVTTSITDVGDAPLRRGKDAEVSARAPRWRALPATSMGTKKPKFKIRSTL